MPSPPPCREPRRASPPARIVYRDSPDTLTAAIVLAPEIAAGGRGRDPPGAPTCAVRQPRRAGAAGDGDPRRLARSDAHQRRDRPRLAPRRQPRRPRRRTRLAGRRRRHPAGAGAAIARATRRAPPPSPRKASAPSALRHCWRASRGTCSPGSTASSARVSAPSAQRGPPPAPTSATTSPTPSSGRLLGLDEHGGAIVARDGDTTVIPLTTMLTRP